MKLKTVCLFFCCFCPSFSFADSIVQFTEPVKSILSKTAQKDTVGYDIYNHEDKIAIQRLFKKDCLENAPVYAKTLLENENKILSNVQEKLMILKLLDRVKNIFLVWYKNFEMSYDEVRNLEKEFRQTIRLIEPSYH